MSEPSVRRGTSVWWWGRGLLVAALLVAAYVTWASWAAQGRVAGCGDTHALGCDDVLASRWATWLGLPVSLAALMVYAGALGATFFLDRSSGWWALISAVTLLVGAAMWFVGLQFGLLDTFCKYCLALHGMGLVLATLVAWRLPRELLAKQVSLSSVLGGLATGITGVAVLVAGQLLFVPQRPNMNLFQVAEVKQGDAEPAVDKTASTTFTRQVKHPWEHRRLAWMSGRASIDAYDFPILGNRDAEYLVVEIFDYTCHHCRELYAMNERVREDYPDLALVLIPVPMNKKCNKFVVQDDPMHVTACELCQLAISVWQAKPEAFLEFHHWLMQGGEKPPAVEAARREATRLAGDITPLEKSAAQQMAEFARIYGVTTDITTNGAIPKLIYEGRIASGLPQNEAALKSFFEKEVKAKRRAAKP